MAVAKTKKIYYSMGEVAEMFDVNQSLIRFWEQKFDILKPHKNKKGNRMFTPEDIDNLKLIYHLVKEKGMTLAGAQKRIKENKEGIGRDMEIIEKLQNIKTILQQIKQELKDGKGIEGDDEIVEDADFQDIVTTAVTPTFNAPGGGEVLSVDKTSASRESGEAMGPQPRIIEQTLF